MQLAGITQPREKRLHYSTWLLGQSSARGWIWGHRSVHSPEGLRHLSLVLSMLGTARGQNGVSSSCRHTALSQREKYEMWTPTRAHRGCQGRPSTAVLGPKQNLVLTKP